MPLRSAISFGVLLACFSIASAQSPEIRRDSVGVAVPALHPAGVVSDAIQPLSPSIYSGTVERLPQFSFDSRSLEQYNHSLRNSALNSWTSPVRGLTVVGWHSYDDHPYLLTTRSATVGLNYRYRGLTIQAGVSAANLVPMEFDPMNQFGVNASIGYRFSPSVSLTVFGQYYNNAPYFNLATRPYVNSSRYGAYATFRGDRFGIDLGAQRYVDPMTGRWEIAPIVTPSFKISDKFSIVLPVGDLIKCLYDNNNHRLDNNLPPAHPKGPPRP